MENGEQKMNKIDIQNWNRKEHFEFFSKMKSPFLGITANVKITSGYQKVKENKYSLFAYYLHSSMKAVNTIREFKYRIIDNEVFELEKINAGSTILREDKTFGFIYVEFDEDFNIFNNRLKSEINEVKISSGLRLNNEDIKTDLIRHTTIPWVSFTSLLHPTHFNNTDSVPKISFGKIFESDKEMFLPVSVEAHHGLIDGYHIGEYFRMFEEILNL